jgi:hypothetical protein
MQVAIAQRSVATVAYMDESDQMLWRISRLEAARDQLFEGNLNALARKLELRDGSYLGQMLRGVRPITEKFVKRFEEAIGRPGWFDQGASALSAQALEIAQQIDEFPEGPIRSYVIRMCREVIAFARTGGEADDSTQERKQA